VTVGQLLALAWRESRFARRRLFLFLSAISLGVASLVAVQGFAGNLARGVQREARALLGADLVLSSRETFGPQTEALLDSLRGAGAPVALRTSFMSMALAPATGATRLAQVRAPESGYPFYGEIETVPAAAWDRLHDGRAAIVDPALLAALGVQQGDSLAIGEARFRIIAALGRVPGDVEIASAFAPRVFIPARFLDETGLLGFGSRIENEAFIALPAPGAADRIDAERGEALRAERVRSRTVAEQQEGLAEAFGRLTSYLGLIGVLALLLGGIGVASATGAYMARKTETVAVLRCLGATSKQVFAIYLAQAAVMGAAGAALGAVIGVAVQWALPGLLTGLLPVEVRATPEPAAIATGVAVGLGTALVFAALPLLGIRRISPLAALRATVSREPSGSPDRARLAALAAIAAAALLLIWLQIGDVAVAVGMLAGLAAVLAALWLLAIGLTRAVHRLPRAGIPYLVRQGIANLHRPGNQTATVVMSLGFGVFLLATLLLTQHNLLLPLRADGAADRANLLLWDVQDDQLAGVDSLMTQQGAPPMQSAPIIPMRVAAINGTEIRPWTEDEIAAAEFEDEAPEGWAVRREYRSTYRDNLTGGERLTDGAFWDQEGGDPAQVSLEVDIAEELGVEIGDTIVWNVQGVRLPTEVTSLRAVDWARFEPNFFAVFPSAALADAPKTWVVLARGGTPAARADIQGAIVARFPNVAAVDLTNVQEALDNVIGRISAVISFLGAFSVATGFVVLVGAVATGRLRRIREGVLLKTLGATRSQIGGILLTEYAILGLLSVVAGILLAGAAGWALSRWLFDVPFELTAGPLLALALSVAALATVIGVWASREVFARTPLEALREEVS
jgi:putative ABC transport system permease protein